MQGNRRSFSCQGEALSYIPIFCNSIYFDVHDSDVRTPLIFNLWLYF